MPEGVVVALYGWKSLPEITAALNGSSMLAVLVLVVEITAFQAEEPNDLKLIVAGAWCLYREN